jgi:hypothetical protein
VTSHLYFLYANSDVLDVLEQADALEAQAAAAAAAAEAQRFWDVPDVVDPQPSKGVAQGSDAMSPHLT